MVVGANLPALDRLLQAKDDCKQAMGITPTPPSSANCTSGPRNQHHRGGAAHTPPPATKPAPLTPPLGIPKTRIHPYILPSWTAYRLYHGTGRYQGQKVLQGLFSRHNFHWQVGCLTLAELGISTVKDPEKTKAVINAYTTPFTSHLTMGGRHNLAGQPSPRSPQLILPLTTTSLPLLGVSVSPLPSACQPCS